VAEAIAFAAPRTEELTKVAVGVVGAGLTGVVQGVIVKLAPQMGAAAPILTWGSLLGTPVLGTMGALFTRGMLGDLFAGVAAGGVAILGYTLPALVMPTTGRRREIDAGGVKQLGQGTVAQRAQEAAARSLGVKSSLEF